MPKRRCGVVVCLDRGGDRAVSREAELNEAKERDLRKPYPDLMRFVHLQREMYANHIAALRFERRVANQKHMLRVRNSC
jgi:hypothetical protein